MDPCWLNQNNMQMISTFLLGFSFFHVAAFMLNLQQFDVVM
jgi:hypothetical protein